MIALVFRRVLDKIEIQTSKAKITIKIYTSKWNTRSKLATVKKTPLKMYT